MIVFLQIIFYIFYMQKLIRKHQWITKPDLRGISYFGLTDFAKNYFLRLDSITHDQYFKTRYGIMFRSKIQSFMDQVTLRYNLENKLQVSANLDRISLSEKMQFDRFCIKQDQVFSQLNTVQFDVTLTAPVSMRILSVNHSAAYEGRVYQPEWLYMVEILNMSELEKLQSQKEYEKQGKIIQYQGLFI